MWKALIILILSAAIFGTAGYFCYDILVRPHKLAQAEANLPPPTPPPDPSLEDFQKAEKLRAAGKLSEVKATLESLLETYPTSTKLAEARAMLGEANIKLFYSTEPSPDKEIYVIKPGDAIAKIQRKFKTTPEMLMRVNGIDDPRKLSIGQKLIIPHPQFSLAIDRQAKTVTLFNHGKFFKEYQPRTWNLPPVKNPKPTSGKVIGKLAWKNDAMVAFGSPDFADSAKWVQLSQPGYTLYGESDDPAVTFQKPPTGIGFSRADSEELSTLLGGGTPVSIK